MDGHGLFVLRSGTTNRIDVVSFVSTPADQMTTLVDNLPGYWIYDLSFRPNSSPVSGRRLAGSDRMKTAMAIKRVHLPEPRPGFT